MNGEIKMPPWSWFMVPTSIFCIFPTIAAGFFVFASLSDPIMLLHSLRALMLYAFLPIGFSLAAGSIAYRVLRGKPLDELSGGIAGAVVGLFIVIAWYVVYLQYETMGWLKPPTTSYSQYTNTDAPPAAAGAVGEVLFAIFGIVYMMGQIAVGKKLARHVTAEAADVPKASDPAKASEER